MYVVRVTVLLPHHIGLHVFAQHVPHVPLHLGLPGMSPFGENAPITATPPAMQSLPLPTNLTHWRGYLYR